jgi:hypothetical protein
MTMKHSAIPSCWLKRAATVRLLPNAESPSLPRPAEISIPLIVSLTGNLNTPQLGVPLPLVQSLLPSLPIVVMFTQEGGTLTSDTADSRSTQPHSSLSRECLLGTIYLELSELLQLIRGESVSFSMVHREK